VAAEGAAVHPGSQILERLVPRADLTALLGTDRVLQDLVRLGIPDHDPEHAPRWRVEAIPAE